MRVSVPPQGTQWPLTERALARGRESTVAAVGVPSHCRGGRPILSSGFSRIQQVKRAVLGKILDTGEAVFRIALDTEGVLEGGLKIRVSGVQIPLPGHQILEPKRVEVALGLLSVDATKPLCER